MSTNKLYGDLEMMLPFVLCCCCFRANVDVFFLLLLLLLLSLFPIAKFQRKALCLAFNNHFQNSLPPGISLVTILNKHKTLFGIICWAIIFLCFSCSTFTCFLFIYSTDRALMLCYVMNVMLITSYRSCSGSWSHFINWFNLTEAGTLLEHKQNNVYN